MKILLFIFLCCNFWSTTFAARILGVLHVPTSSHFAIGVTLFNSLAERGHQVTILSAMDPKLNNSNVRYIYLDGVFEALSAHQYDFRSSWTSNTFADYVFLIRTANALTDSTLKSNAVQKLMNSGEKFDVVFIGQALNQAFVGLGEYFNAQVIVLSAANSFLSNMLYGSEVPYSFVANSLSSYTDKMNFQERLSNTYLYVYYHIMHKIYSIPKQEQIYNEHFPHAVEFNTAVKNVSLHFVNTHVVYDSPRPYLPNMIPIGGLHVKPPKKLPKDIQEYLDNAKEGVIFFSLGSYIQGKDITKEAKQTILNTFAKLPQKVLWKFEDDLPEKANNVKILKWVPQSDILAHPNIKLFITHGGQLSSVEAIHRGVPILGIPFRFDQFNNIAYFAKSGYGEQILFPHITEETFMAKIQQILSNSSYKKNMVKASQIVQDQPETPLERAIFWTEHILKHGPSHLRPACLDLSTAEYLLLDVAAFVVLIILFTFLAIYFTVKTILRNIARYKHCKEE